jgi:hypothetical protein
MTLNKGALGRCPKPPQPIIQSNAGRIFDHNAKPLKVCRKRASNGKRRQAARTPKSCGITERGWRLEESFDLLLLRAVK